MSSDHPTGTKTNPETQPAKTDRIDQAARLAMQRDLLAREEPEPSLGSRLGQIGILGWAIVIPALLGVVIGRWLDRRYGGGIFFTAPLLMLGAAFGLWSAWRWMHRQSRS
jgi:ATP synthase protein I